MRTFDYTQFYHQKWDSETLFLVGTLRELKGRQELYVLQKPTEWARIEKQSVVDCLDGVNGLAAWRISQSRLRQLIACRVQPRTKEEKLALGYAEVLKTIRQRYLQIPVKASYLLDLHRQLFSRFGGGGRLKEEQNYRSEVRADGRSYVRFLPPSPYETPEAVFSLCGTIEQSLAQYGTEPLLSVFAWIGDFLCIYPFDEGNEELAWLLLTLALLRCGVRVVQYVSIEKILLRRREEFLNALNRHCVGWHDGKNDPLPLQKCLLNILLEAYREFESRVGRVCTRSTALAQVQAAVAERNGRFTKRDLLLACPSIGRASVENALRQMTASGELVRHGVGKATYYTKF